MSSNPPRNALHRFSLILTAATALLWLPHVACAQPDDAHTPKIIDIEIFAKGKAADVKDVELRPNTGTVFGFDVKNGAGEELADVTIKVVQVVDGNKRIIAEGKIEKLDITPEKGKGTGGGGLRRGRACAHRGT